MTNELVVAGEQGEGGIQVGIQVAQVLLHWRIVIIMLQHLQHIRGSTLAVDTKTICLVTIGCPQS